MSDREREKLTFSELDRLRREKGRGASSRGGRARQEDARATRAALVEAEGVFSSGPGGAEGARLEGAVRDAHGTAELAAACRAYRDQLGLPADTSLLSLFLDAGERDLVVAALEALLAQQAAGSLEIGPGLRSQLRLLAQDRDDTVAGISEELLQG